LKLLGFGDSGGYGASELQFRRGFLFLVWPALHSLGSDPRLYLSWPFNA